MWKNWFLQTHAQCFPGRSQGNTYSDFSHKHAEHCIQTNPVGATTTSSWPHARHRALPELCGVFSSRHLSSEIVSVINVLATGIQFGSNRRILAFE